MRRRKSGIAPRAATTRANSSAPGEGDHAAHRCGDLLHPLSIAPCAVYEKTLVNEDNCLTAMLVRATKVVQYKDIG